MKVEILSVGNEVLSGKVVNTNASFLSIELEKSASNPSLNSLPIFLLFCLSLFRLLF